MTDKRPRSSAATKAVLAALALYFVPACGLGLASGGQYGFLVGLPFRAAFGVVTFPLRTLGHVEVSGSALASFGVFLAGFVIAMHLLARRLWAGWTARLTAAVTLTTTLLFVAAMAVAGLAHQVGWFMTTEERLVDNPWIRGMPCRPTGPTLEGLDAWRIEPLDGLPLGQTRRYLALPRIDDDDDDSRPRRPLLCDPDGRSGGTPVDEHEVKALLGGRADAGPESSPVDAGPDGAPPTAGGR